MLATRGERRIDHQFSSDQFKLIGKINHGPNEPRRR
jgi:hypothetical protein